MNFTSLIGTWENEFGSTMQITQCDPNSGFFTGLYKSHTGATGVYNVFGVTDTNPDPTINSQTLSFSISWRSISSSEKSNPFSKESVGGEGTNSDNWVSAFSGQLQVMTSPENVVYLLITTTYLLQKNTDPSENWDSTVVAPSTFHQTSSSVDLNSDIKKKIIEKSIPKASELNTQAVYFALERGTLADNGATPWTTTVGLGTPAQRLKYMLDTGTDNTWITSVQCTTDACMKHGRFNPSASSSFEIIDPTPTSKDFGPWGTMLVTIGEDVFSLYLTLKTAQPELFIGEQMNFELAVNYTGDQFAELAADGGIAIPSPYWTGSGTTEALLLQLISHKIIYYPIVSMSTNPSTGTGECYFGSVDYSKFNYNTLQWIALQNLGDSPLNYLWSIPINSFLVGGNPVAVQISNFVLDSGSSFFKGPSDLINTLINSVTMNGILPTSTYNYQDLNNYSNITLSLGNQSYTLTPQQYFLQYTDNQGVPYWKIGIEVLDGMPEGMLLVGSLFLDTIYCIFNYYNKCIGIALY